MTGIDIDALGARAERMITELGAISAEPGRLVRLYLTAEHRRAADLVAGWMRAAGMATSEDALGTVRGHWGTAGRRLLIGSHIDTVVDAGKYDGPLGVVAGILAAEQVARRGKSLRFGVDVLAFGDEEGSRFPSTLATSAGCAGAFDRGTLALTDHTGMAFGDALTRYGKTIEEIASAAYRRDEVAAYVEVHIEQGPVLEREGEPLGVVTGIVGQSRLRATVWGEAGHAGTVPMRLRRDALAGATEIIQRIERIANGYAQHGMVATVGWIEAVPGSSNIIPSRVDFTVDLRAMDDAARLAAVETIRAEAAEIAAARRLDVAFERFHDAPAVACAPTLQEAFVQAVTAVGHHPIRLPSGAGHDAQMMARLCPVGMLFVRCRGGISHNPAEYASPRDMGTAVAALVRFIDTFDTLL